MSDITLYYDSDAIRCDWKAGTGDLVCGDDLQTAILISLLTDRLADASDDTGGSDRRGWWGDTGQDWLIGSRLWLLRREKLTTQVALRAEMYASEALQWMLDDGVVSSVTTEARIVYPDRLYLTVSYLRPDSDTAEYQGFSWVWET
ncbi:phage GP46 family protein [Escherichia coli]|nr:phage GP46 family protein [Escherichia coli]EHR9096935.1 phage GP46 family protein [Escherichia coli]EIM2919070.1 phage GP46 family protein [Escherichia coli]EIM2935032.1 phage GP46 family protein [Escherichia coli]EIM2940337.1 phage GP46 family protein [Escherichia coli]